MRLTKQANRFLVPASLALLAAGAGFAAGWTLRGEPRVAEQAPLPSVPAAAATATAPAAAAEPSPTPEPALKGPVAKVPPAKAAPEPAAVPTPASPASPRKRPVRKSPQELLAAAGFDPASAQELSQRFDGFARARRILREEARRDEQAASYVLASKLRQEIGDDGYGYMLWSNGAPNRVVVTGVTRDSNASRADIQPQDVVLRYDGQRIFEVEELRFLVQQSSPRTRAEVELLRDGRPIRVSVPRGTLGIVINGTYDPPLEPSAPGAVQSP